VKLLAVLFIAFFVLAGAAFAELPRDAGQVKLIPGQKEFNWESWHVTIDKLVLTSSVGYTRRKGPAADLRVVLANADYIRRHPEQLDRHVELFEAQQERAVEANDYLLGVGCSKKRRNRQLLGLALARY
jgi:hypothetical protein